MKIVFTRWNWAECSYCARYRNIITKKAPWFSNLSQSFYEIFIEETKSEEGLRGDTMPSSKTKSWQLNDILLIVSSPTENSLTLPKTSDQKSYKVPLLFNHEILEYHYYYYLLFTKDSMFSSMELLSMIVLLDCETPTESLMESAVISKFSSPEAIEVALNPGPLTLSSTL